MFGNKDNFAMIILIDGIEIINYIINYYTLRIKMDDSHNITNTINLNKNVVK